MNVLLSLWEPCARPRPAVLSLSQAYLQEDNRTTLMYSGNGLASCDLTLDVMEAEQPLV